MESDELLAAVLDLIDAAFVWADWREGPLMPWLEVMAEMED